MATLFFGQYVHPTQRLKSNTMKNKFLLSLGMIAISSSATFGLASRAAAFDVKAGPIWNNDDAKVKCPVATASHGAQWNGQWRTTVQGKESVCGAVKVFDVKAGPIWSNDDAKVKCPVAAASHNGKWNGQWRTTVQGKESVCSVVKG